MRLDHLQHVTDQPFILFELRDASLKCRGNRFGGQDGLAWRMSSSQVVGASNPYFASRSLR